MGEKGASVIDWAGLTQEMELLLRLKTSPVAYKRLDKVEELEKIPEVVRLERRASFCQVPALVRTIGMTVGATRDNFGDRCARINGLAPTTEKQVAWEADSFANTWFANVEEARKQMAEYPLVPPGEAIALAPLAAGKFDPDVILIYANPAQMMLLMNALQFKDYERFQFFFSSAKDLAPMAWLSVIPPASRPWLFPAWERGRSAPLPRMRWLWRYHRK